MRLTSGAMIVRMRAGAVAVLGALALAAPAVAQDTGVFRVGSEIAVPPSIIGDGTIDAVSVSGVTAGSPQEAAVLAAMNTRIGGQVNWLEMQRGLAAVRALEGVAGARFILERTSNPTRTRLLITVEPTARPADAARFPTLVRTDSSQVTLIVNGAFGAYSDSNPWFGDPQTFTQRSPVATALPTGRRASWGEASVEAGAGAITRIGNSPFYVYGAATAMFTAAAGQDLFTDDTRGLVRVEKLYAGLIFGEKGSGRAVNLSAGRQNFNLGDGFLFSQFSGSANAGPRPGLFLNPRIAFDNAALVDIRFDRLRLRAFYLDPDELEDFESNTHFAGLSAVYNFTPGTRLGITYALIPQSDTRFRQPGGTTIRREGIETIAFEGRLDDPLGLKGLWLQSEYAHQWRASEMRAWGAYGTIGWRSDAGWKPSLSYRYAAFSGDDPATARYERYDPMLSGGLGEWVQGVNFKKLVGNANINVHRIRATAKPSDKLNLTLDLFDFQARELNNLGATPALSTLQSRDIGREITLRGDWFISRKLFLLLVASHAVPGDAIRLATPTGGKAWTTLQASAFWTF
jgi:hypothetical protein